MTFVDTSALYALVDADDDNHGAAARQFALLEGTVLLTHNYVLVETIALVQRRLGMAVLRRFLGDLAPVVQLDWVDEDLHAGAASALAAGGQRHVSFVDRVSFEVMRRRGLGTAFAFDDDFATEGFVVVPSPRP